MKKWLLFGVCFGVLYLLFRPFPEPTMSEIVESYEESWGITLPVPHRFEQIWATKNPSHGDGEWVSVWHYDADLPELTASEFNLITTENEADISDMVNRFITNTINTHLGDQETQAEIRAAFQQHPVEILQGDSYFHQEKKAGKII